jgi:hypothetical protein
LAPHSNGTGYPRWKVFIEAYLQAKNIIDDASCKLCGDPDETSDHIMFLCPVASAQWQQVSLPDCATVQVRELWSVPALVTLPAAQNSVFVFLCC